MYIVLWMLDFRSNLWYVSEVTTFKGHEDAIQIKNPMQILEFCFICTVKSSQSTRTFIFVHNKYWFVQHLVYWFAFEWHQCIFIHTYFFNYSEEIRYIYLLTFWALGIYLLICPCCEGFIICCLEIDAKIWNLELSCLGALRKDEHSGRNVK